MIRIGLPPPALPRLRLSWDTARSQALRHSRAVHELVVRTAHSTRTGWQRFYDRMASVLRFRVRAIVRQQAALTAFEQPYEEMVELVCYAAQDFLSDEERDAKFAELRIAMRLRYRPLRKQLRSFLPDAKDSDPFELLFLPDCIEKVIHAEMGLETMMRARTAMQSYRDALESRLPKK